MRRLARALLVVALLLAQHTALTHQLDHVTGVPEEQGTLCDSHDLLGTVLGVAAGAAPGEQLLLLAHAHAAARPVIAPQAHALAPKSRGPPPIS